MNDPDCNRPRPLPDPHGSKRDDQRTRRVKMGVNMRDHAMTVGMGVERFAVAMLVGVLEMLRMNGIGRPERCDQTADTENHQHIQKNSS